MNKLKICMHKKSLIFLLGLGIAPIISSCDNNNLVYRKEANDRLKNNLDQLQNAFIQLQNDNGKLTNDNTKLTNDNTQLQNDNGKLTKDLAESAAVNNNEQKALCTIEKIFEEFKNTNLQQINEVQKLIDKMVQENDSNIRNKYIKKINKKLKILYNHNIQCN